MKIFFQYCKPQTFGNTLAPVSLEIDGEPSTVAQLIQSTVEKIVDDYNKKPRRDFDDPSNPPEALKENEIQDLASRGKVAFGLIFNEKMADPNKSVETAIRAYEDGLFKIFINEKPAGELSSKIALKDGDILTVVRLTFLSGIIM